MVLVILLRRWCFLLYSPLLLLILGDCWVPSGVQHWDEMVHSLSCFGSLVLISVLRDRAGYRVLVGVRVSVLSDGSWVRRRLDTVDWTTGES
eukprot:8100912-Pyramimonas_sp.AAC.1